MALHRFAKATDSLHVRFRNARLRARGENFGVSDNFVFVEIESVAVAIRACSDMARDD